MLGSRDGKSASASLCFRLEGGWLLVPSPREQVTGHEETILGCAKGGSGWVWGKISSLKGWSGPGTASRAGGETPYLEVPQRCVDVALGDRVALLGGQLDLMILKSFSNQSQDSKSGLSD